MAKARYKIHAANDADLFLPDRLIEITLLIQLRTAGFEGTVVFDWYAEEKRATLRSIEADEITKVEIGARLEPIIDELREIEL